MSTNLSDKIHKIITAKNGKIQNRTPDAKKKYLKMKLPINTDRNWAYRQFTKLPWYQKRYRMVTFLKKYPLKLQEIDKQFVGINFAHAATRI